MHTQTSSNIMQCELEAILRYLDGEMSLDQECIFEEHISGCKDCHDELNEQKKMLAALDFAFEDDSSIEPPKDFAKIVAAKAESGVNGLRHPKERPMALLFCLVLTLLVVAGLAFGTEGFFPIAVNLAEQVYSVLVLAGHLVYDISLGLVIVLRSLSHQTVLYSYSIGVVSVLLLFLIMFAGYAFRLHAARK